MGSDGLQLRALLFSCLFLCALASASSFVLLLCWWFVLPSLLMVELLIFPFIFLLKYRHLNQQPLCHAPLRGYDPRAVFNRFTKDQAKLSKYLCIKDMMQKWFGGVPISKIKKGNVADLLAYGFWYKSREQLESEGQGHLPDQLVAELEEAWGVSFEPGYNKDLPFMSHLWQGLRCHYRPFVFYVGIELLFAMKHIIMLGTGFEAHVHRGTTFYTHGMHLNSKRGAAASGTAAQTPVLFLHGVGLGLLPYITFVLRLVASGQPVLAIESNHLGMRWVHQCPGEDDVVDVIVDILDQCGIESASVVGHSYGTFMSSRLVQRFPERVQSLVLIDPVCFVMFSGKLILNFVYEPHKSAITTWFVARDIHHSASVCRNFFWSLLNLWPEQLPEKTLVVLSGKDELVPVKETITMLEAETNVEILYHDHHCHAEFIKDLPWQDKVVTQVVRLARLPADNPGIEKLMESQPSDLPRSASSMTESSQELSGPDVQLDIVLSGPGSLEEHTARFRGPRTKQHSRTDSASSWQNASVPQ